MTLEAVMWCRCGHHDGQHVDRAIGGCFAKVTTDYSRHGRTYQVSTRCPCQGFMFSDEKPIGKVS